MAGFGKADTGLIKATAGAEAGQYIDENLMIGSAIGSAMDVISKKQAATQKKNEALQKEIAKNFNATPSGLDDGLKEFVMGEMGQNVRDYANTTGTGVEANMMKESYITNSNNTAESASATQGNINYIRSEEFEVSSSDKGTDRETFYLHLKNKGEVNYYKKLGNDGKPQIMMAIPKETYPQFLTAGTGDYNTHKALEDLEKEEKLNNEQKVQLQEFRDEELSYLEWKNKGEHTNADGSFNPDKYIIQNGAKLSTGEDMNNKALVTSVYNDNVTNITSNAALKVNRSAEDYAAQVTETLNETSGKNKFNITGRTMQDIAFNSNLGFGTDWDNDGETDSFASIFINGINTDKKDLYDKMYTNIDGTPINWDFKSLGFTDEQILLYDKNGDGKIEHNTDEWKAIEADGHSKKMLEFWLRGMDEDGGEDPDKRTKWIKNRYASFMGEVMNDARKAKQKEHFSGLGVYFDSQGKDGDSNISSVYDSKTAMQDQKQITYNKTKLNVALPESIVKGGITAENLKKAIPILEKQFPNVEFDGDTRGDIYTGKFKVNDEEFDFSGDKNNATEYERLTMLLVKEDATSDDSVAIRNLGTSIDDDSWVNFKNKKYENYPEMRIEEKYTAGQYNEFEIDGQLVRDQEITIISYNPTNGKYGIQTNTGLKGEVDLQLKK